MQFGPAAFHVLGVLTWLAAVIVQSWASVVFASVSFFPTVLPFSHFAPAAPTSSLLLEQAGHFQFQGLWTSCSLCLECFSPDGRTAGSPFLWVCARVCSTFQHPVCPRTLHFLHLFPSVVFLHRACMHPKLIGSCPTLCDPMDCSPPGSSVHGILQARVLEWVAILPSRGSSRPRD